MNISSNIYTDTKIDIWAEQLPFLKGSSKIINNLIKTPLNDKEKILERQQCYIKLSEDDKEILKKYENNIYWLDEIDHLISNNDFIEILYPSNFILKIINNYRPILELYHLYKIIIIPLFVLISPIFVFLTPFYYFKRLFNISFIFYIKNIWKIIKLLFTTTGDLKKNIIKFISIISYIILYFYNIYQTIDLSYLIYKTRTNLLNNMKGLSIFVNKSIDVINQYSIDSWKPFYIYDNLDINIKLNNDISTIYKIWKNNNYKQKINNIINIIYTIDIVDSISSLKDSNKWCIANFTNETKLWGMNNPLLSNNKQISNPVDLKKNIIITGPNAAGKTTYIKTIATNIILAQTFGICNAIKANIILYDSIKTFMRITDVLGSKSYFESEIEYCTDMINNAIELAKNNKRGLFILDEPMHSTPPIEGMSVAYAILNYIGNINNIQLLITTHFHKLIDLEYSNSEKFINLHFDANLNDKNKYDFNYKLHRGFSKKCIAIELLDKDKLPLDVINSAIEIKNKLCNDFYSK